MLKKNATTILIVFGTTSLTLSILGFNSLSKIMWSLFIYTLFAIFLPLDIKNKIVKIICYILVALTLSLDIFTNFIPNITKLFS